MPYSVRRLLPYVWRWHVIGGAKDLYGYATNKAAAKRAAAANLPPRAVAEPVTALPAPAPVAEPEDRAGGT
jgi:hypothetical protein